MEAITVYHAIGHEKFQENLIEFIREIIPAAERHVVLMAIHPDDPPWPLLGLPRIVGHENDIDRILSAVDSPSNGLTFCTGSFGASYKNDITKMADKYADRINFIHLRNLTRNNNGDFMESHHMEGDIDLYAVMKILLLEQKRRQDEGRSDTRLPMRPNHGHLAIPELKKPGIYPGYSLFGRMKGLAELRGLEIGIQRSLGL